MELYVYTSCNPFPPPFLKSFMCTHTNYKVSRKNILACSYVMSLLLKMNCFSIWFSSPRVS